jgi:hypothetical protein
VFLIAGLATLIAGVAALVGGKLRSDAQLTRYGVWAVAVLVVAVLVIVVTKSLQPRAGTLLTRWGSQTDSCQRCWHDGGGRPVGECPTTRRGCKISIGRHRQAPSTLPHDPDQVAPGPIHVAEMGLIDTVSQ